MKQSTIIVILLVLILVVSIGLLWQSYTYQETIKLVEVPAQVMIYDG